MPVSQPVDHPALDLPRATGLSAMLAGRLAAAIQAGNFRPGERMPTEKQLVERYSVSRAVVREAIARLKTDGFVETRQGAGAFVAANPGLANFRIAPPGSDPGLLEARDLLHVFELRAVIEAGMAELAAARRTAADITALRAACAGMEQALQASDESGAAGDDSFHAAIAAAAHNPYLAQFATFLAQHFSATRALTWQPAARAAGAARAAQEEHRRLLDAIVAGDAAAASEAARSHIAQAAARYAAAKPRS
jgi:GntR family transcriptional repressor for pyruvate dehydrogenase complex